MTSSPDQTRSTAFCTSEIDTNAPSRLPSVATRTRLPSSPRTTFAARVTGVRRVLPISPSRWAPISGPVMR